MIYLITGVPGSGKTYYAVNKIYEFINDKDCKYKYIYTNINLNFKKCEQIKSNFVKQLVLDDLLQRIEKDYELSELFKNNKLFDEETGELITDYDLYVRNKLKLFEPYEHSLIILDECHLYFTEKTDPKMLRFLSYHRHFDIDLYLITQNKSLINRKYLAFVENMIIGVNPSKRFFSKVFVYKIYASYKEYNSNLAGKEKLKFDKKIADCYNSGSNKIPKSFTQKLLLPLIIISIIAFGGFFLFKNYITCDHLICNVKKETKSFNTSSVHKDVKNQNHSNSIIVERVVSDNQDNFLDNYKFYYQLICFKNKCIVDNDFSISKYFILQLPQISNSKIYYQGNYLSNQILYLATNIDLTKFKPGGQYNEENSSNSNFIFK